MMPRPWSFTDDNDQKSNNAGKPSLAGQGAPASCFGVNTKTRNTLMKHLGYLAGAMLCLCSLAEAGDLVLDLGGSNTYRIPLSSSTNINISPVTGDITARPLNTFGSPADGWCPWVPDAPQPPVFTNLLSATVTSLPIGGGTTVLSWAVTGTPTPVCSTSSSTFPPDVTSVSGWNTTMPASSAGTTLALTTSGLHTFRLSCTNSGGTATQAVTVSVAHSDVPFCSLARHQPPAGMTQMNSFVNTANTRAAGNQEWAAGTTLNTNRWKPDPISPPNGVAPARSLLGRWGYVTGDTAVIPVPSNQFLAFDFYTTGAAVNRAGTVSWEQPGENSAPLFVTISPCPGDPDPAEPRCISPYNGASGLGWRFGSTPSSWCPLTAGTRYYLNVFFRRPDVLAVSDCTVGTCWWLVTQSCQQGCEADPPTR